jgi:hypothetical protein
VDRQPGADAGPELGAVALEPEVVGRQLGRVNDADVLAAEALRSVGGDLRERGPERREGIAPVAEYCSSTYWPPTGSEEPPLVLVRTPLTIE